MSIIIFAFISGFSLRFCFQPSYFCLHFTLSFRLIFHPMDIHFEAMFHMVLLLLLFLI